MTPVTACGGGGSAHVTATHLMMYGGQSLCICCSSTAPTDQERVSVTVNNQQQVELMPISRGDVSANPVLNQTGAAC